MSSRVENNVTVIGTVIKGPIPKVVAGTKKRANYQIEIQAKSYDKGQTFMPFVISRGNQAESDLENIKTGDIVVVNGRIITRPETQMRFFVHDTKNTDQLIEKEEGELTDDDECFYFEDKRLVTNILAEDVFNMTDLLSKLPEEKVKQMVSPKVLERVFKRMNEAKLKEKEKENNTFDDTLDD